MSSGLPSRRVVRALLMSCASLTACSGAPSVGVLGAYFPDWLFCVAGGALLMSGVHVLLWRHGRGAWLAPPVLVYPALTVLFSTALWAVSFNL